MRWWHRAVALVFLWGPIVRSETFDTLICGQEVNGVCIVTEDQSWLVGGSELCIEPSNLRFRTGVAGGNLALPNRNIHSLEVSKSTTLDSSCFQCGLRFQGFQSVTVHGTIAGSRISFDIEDSLMVSSDGVVTTTGRGYSNGRGPGGGAAGCSRQLAGASHRGMGGISCGSGCALPSSTTYAVDPYGSGGARISGEVDASGGGIIIVTGARVVIDGSIESDGNSCDLCGAGSGGTVHIRSQFVQGAGRISARGGSASDFNGAGGGGGEIKIAAESLQSVVVDV